TSVTTNDTGNYQFSSLQPGNYSVTATAAGFQTATFKDVRLSQNQQVRQNFTLEVVSQADTALTTTQASVGNVLTSAQILSLPVQSRNVLDFTTTTAGVIKIN